VVQGQPDQAGTGARLDRAEPMGGSWLDGRADDWRAGPDSDRSQGARASTGAEPVGGAWLRPRGSDQRVHRQLGGGGQTRWRLDLWEREEKGNPSSMPC
jgi:hypothetical protein